MKSWILLLLLLSQNVFAFALTDFRIAQTEIEYIYDGDTFFITCRPELQCNKGKLGICPPNVDTPEIKGKCTVYCQGQQLHPTCERRAARVPPEQENPRGRILPTITTAAVTIATASMLLS